MSRDDTINMEHYEILSLAHKICNVCQKLSKRCPGGLCGNAVRKAKEIYYSQFAKDKKVRANGMREKQMIEEMDLVVLNCYRNKYYTDGNSTEQGIIANAINDILPILVSLKNCEYRKQQEGEWLFVQERRLFGDKYYICSNCQSRNPTMIKFNYCFNCGAKMVTKPKGGAE